MDDEVRIRFDGDKKGKIDKYYVFAFQKVRLVPFFFCTRDAFISALVAALAPKSIGLRKPFSITMIGLLRHVMLPCAVMARSYLYVCIHDLASGQHS